MSLQCNKKTISSEKSEFVTISNAPALAKILEKANKETLVVFDVDMVLLNTKELVFQIPNLDLHDKIISSMKSKYSHEEFDYLVHCALVRIEFELLHPIMSEIVKRLQMLNISTMACTALLSGLIDSKHDMMEWRTKQLAMFGIDFSSTAPDDAAFQTIQFPTYRENVPQYKNGVMITNGEHSLTHKGMVLTSLLSTMPVMPKQIIMIDDKMQNLENIEMSLNEIAYDGNYLAVEFTAAKYVDCPLVSAEEFMHGLQKLLGDVL
ncbi:MAG: DUF2608 domain-containing protein [Pseudomonadota bacterium]